MTYVSKNDEEKHGPVKRSFGIPKRQKKKKKKFEWVSNTGTSYLTSRIPALEDKTFYLFTGVPKESAQFLSTDVIAGTIVAKTFIELIEKNFRNLTTNMLEKEVRSMGELHGPIKWSETLSWRSTSFGAEHFYVSKAQIRSYNCPENRILVAALDKIAKSVPKKIKDTREDLEAVRVARKADLILNHRHLKDVPILSPDKLSFDKKRTRMAKKSDIYSSALDILRVRDFQQKENLPEANEILYLTCDDRTKAIHRLVAELNSCLENFETQPKELKIKTEENNLRLGEIEFRGGKKQGYVMWNNTILEIYGHTQNTSIESTKNKIVSVNHPDDLHRFIEATLRSSF